MANRPQIDVSAVPQPTGARPEHDRGAWYASLRRADKGEILFELELQLTGLVCFGATKAATPGDETARAREHARVTHAGIVRAHTLADSLLGVASAVDRLGAAVAHVAHAVPRAPSQSSLTPVAPHEGLSSLRDDLSRFDTIFGGLLALDTISQRQFRATYELLARELVRNPFFRPLAPRELRVETDCLADPSMLAILERCPDTLAERPARHATLGFTRALRTLDRIEESVHDETQAELSLLLLAVLRRDLRALAHYLCADAASEIADGLETELLATHAADMHARAAAFRVRSQRLTMLSNGLRAIGVVLASEVDTVCGPYLEGPIVLGPAARASLGHASEDLRVVLEGAMRALMEELVTDEDSRAALDRLGGRRALAARRRREVWMFMQITRAFVAKARAWQPPSESWEAGPTGDFAPDFLAHFRTLGEALTRVQQYERRADALRALHALREPDVLEAAALERAVTECDRFYAFLERRFVALCQGGELEDVPFDRRRAVDTLRGYLAR